MNEEQQALKKAVRQRCLEKRSALGEAARKDKSLLIQRNFLALPEFEQARNVMLFLNFRDEVETTALAEAVLAGGKTLALPRCAPGQVLLTLAVGNLTEDTEPGTWGIREPKIGLKQVEPLSLDLLVVPGLGFDRRGNRLGYGGGYYDRFLKKIGHLTPRIALAFACQVVLEIPVEETDERIDLLVTEDGVMRFTV